MIFSSDSGFQLVRKPDPISRKHEWNIHISLYLTRDWIILLIVYKLFPFFNKPASSATLPPSAPSIPSKPSEVSINPNHLLFFQYLLQAWWRTASARYNLIFDFLYITITLLATTSKIPETERSRAIWPGSSSSQPAEKIFWDYKRGMGGGGFFILSPRGVLFCLFLYFSIYPPPPRSPQSRKQRKLKNSQAWLNPRYKIIYISRAIYNFRGFFEKFSVFSNRSETL